MGRNKLKLKKIEDISARQVTFSKRRQGLFKKAHELSILCNAKVASFVFSPAGRLYKYASSNEEEIFKKWLLQMELEQRTVRSQGKEKELTIHNAGVEENIYFLRELSTERLLQFSTKELNQLETTLEQKLQYVRATKDSKQKAIETIAPSSNCLNLEPNRIAESSTNHLPMRTPSPLPPDLFRVNFAAASFQSGSGIGVVIRSMGGEFMAAMAGFLPGLTDLNVASSMAATKAIEFAVQYSFPNIVVEGDMALNTVQEFNHISELQKLGMNCSFSYVHISANCVAHTLAEYAWTVRFEAVWVLNEPDFLVDVLRADQGLQP